MKLEDKVAIVTGAGSGIGRAIAVGLSKEGAKVVVVDMNLDAAEETMKEISKTKNNSFVIKTDVTKGSDVDTMATRTLEQFGQIDILVNNVGIPGSQEAMLLHTTPEEEWDRVVSVNLKSVYLCSKRVIPEMIKQGAGKIINLSSVAGIVAFPGRAAYTATKGAVSLLTKAMALDYSKYNINVNALCPGMIETPMTKWRLDNPELRKEVLNWIPMERIGVPDDITGAAVFLASSDSNYVSGHLLVVDGGMLTR
ncbi:MAG: SDR family oxidoreductase [Candidatus Dadabacteria bacterium]|nr:MAG: SDR family oxidoreductase [Candidatus Dadabacteria bacterium]TDJ02853.1 MAG: SDR family oxidoreductase [Candidatus Dadabacteria bacterium]